MTTEEMEAKKMCLNAAGYWIRNKAKPFVRVEA
jgi:hypothetical protein